MSSENRQGDAESPSASYPNQSQREPEDVAAALTTRARILFDPRRILPGALGLKWGNSQEDCGADVRGKIVKHSPVWSIVLLDDPEVPDQVILYFDDRGGLSGISTRLYESRDFWDGDWEYDEMEAIEEEYFGHFVQAEQFITQLLGPPDFRGDWETEGIDEARLGAADEVAYWKHAEARIQLEFSHEDKELPFCIDLHLVPLTYSAPVSA